MSVREVYLESAEVVTAFLAQPAVAERWDAPSSLARLRVGGLTAHLAGQVTQVPPVLDAPVVDEHIRLAEHFARSTWIDSGLDSDVNVYIRCSAEEAATAGAAAVTEAATTALAALRRRLPAEPPDRVIQLPWGPWSLSLDDFLVTRLLELAVHCDDLATSIGADTPPFPPSWFDPVISVLCHLAARRHGQPALIRALSRAERAPASIAGL
ncbi:maleylpyruvate isomerase N-terminal domain-containing protein [Actinoplanes oblitus]|uniref:Maleylpyruvate isomerase N-terminal domain-containing protein n=1 Tax=Actinoplanes oblitus TaxID=3040509 RepID=A0ABY8WSQ3_9ACTN|nr:maleylpyruvate isomerase N-terminal domain-containing protein [Actinoplanes oblitus]WIN00659.1 maleylpyruvate isomerase N-terminal domain-containing protein [Actinoplanes oblitus]